MAELERQTAINARTIRYYISAGLLPPAHGRGPSATYDRTHLLRLRAIQQLRNDQHLKLAEIKAQLGEMNDDQIAALITVATAPANDQFLWRRIELHPGIELHVREPAGPARDPEFETLAATIVGMAERMIEQVTRSRHDR